MRFSEATRKAFHFATWCQANQVDPVKVAELRTLVNRRANEWSRQASDQAAVNEKKLDKLDKACTDVANELGLTDFDYPGLYPTFTTPAGRKNQMLPEL